MSSRAMSAGVWLVTAALLLAACGGSSGTDGAGAGGYGGGHMASESLTAPVEGAPEVTVTAVDIDFEPARMDVTAGEPINVTVVNEGETLHDFTLDAADVHVNVEPGESKTTSLTIDRCGQKGRPDSGTPACPART